MQLSAESPSIKILAIWLLNLLLCIPIKPFFKNKCCLRVKKFRHQYSLYYKFILLKNIHSFFRKIDLFATKHSIIIQMILFSIAFYASYCIILRYYPTQIKELEALISKGFFIAPLVTLMVNNQKAIVNHFSAIFTYDEKKGTTSFKNLDKDSIFHHKDTVIRERMIEVIYSVSSSDKIKMYIKFTRTILNESLAVRVGNDHINAKTMIYSGTSLMIGFFLLLFGIYGLALSFLLYSLLLILGKEILAMRSILKRYLFARYLKKLSKEKKKCTPSERKDTIFN